jgi:hypothetical protein
LALITGIINHRLATVATVLKSALIFMDLQGAIDMKRTLTRRPALWLVVAATLLQFAGLVWSAEQSFDTGRVKVVLGRVGGGFIDEVLFDLNGDGKYGADEQVALRPEGEAGVVVEYALARDGYEWGTVVGADKVAGKVNVEDCRVTEAGKQFTAVVTGDLEFGELGSSPFTATIRASRGSAVLVGGLEFTPPAKTENLLLVSAGLRISGRYLDWNPKKNVRGFMSAAGIFRNTPRPDDPYQPMTWQLGGRLVESPVYWREWKAWSDSCSPLTMVQGRVPDRLLTFHMCDPRQGLIVALKHPALTAPNELFGCGMPSSVAAFRADGPSRRVARRQRQVAAGAGVRGYPGRRPVPAQARLRARGKK